MCCWVVFRFTRVKRAHSLWCRAVGERGGSADSVCDMGQEAWVGDYMADPDNHLRVRPRCLLQRYAACHR